MSDSGETGRQYWWVNQNQTHKDEVAGGFLWSPQKNANGARNQFYENMTLVRPGDVVFSFYDTRIQATGVVISTAVAAPKPTFTSGGEGWSNEGWYVEVDFTPLGASFRPKDYMELLRPHLPTKYSPLQASGDGLQSVYLAAVPEPMAQVLLALAGIESIPVPSSWDSTTELDEIREFETSQATLTKTEREVLIKARLGQGLFKSNVRLFESGCRITGLTSIAHLRASHIKPWKNSTNAEKLDGANGLLLSPHVDHLFDRGWISFENDGALIVAPSLEAEVLDRWGLSADHNVGTFKKPQTLYLDFHRTHVLMSA